MARSSQDSSSSKRHFHWTKKIATSETEDSSSLPTFKPSSSFPPISTSKTTEPDKKETLTRTHSHSHNHNHSASLTPKKKLPAVAVARLRSVLHAFGKNRSSLPFGFGPRVIGTLFGHRRGHVHFAFQRDPTSPPAFLIELATPISGLVREMASGLVRIALECDKVDSKEDGKQERKSSNNSCSALRLLEEPRWRTYCNGKKCGFATRRECGAKDWKILKAVEPISMGAGVLPEIGAEGDGELMYMRAKFERIVGSRDSEAFYMMNPDSNGAPELSMYLLRV